VVTITLDMLLAGGWTISEAVVICTKTPKVQEALRVIEEEFQRAAYPGVQLRAVPVASADGMAGDFCTGEELHSLCALCMWKFAVPARRDTLCTCACPAAAKSWA